MALIYATIANGGVMPTAHYATEVRDAEGHVVRQIAPGPQGQVISPATAKTLTTMLVGAVSGPGAFAFGAKIPGVDVAGKTGTAENRPGEPPHGWFVGFAPANAPTIVVAVIVENAADGGLAAAPVGGQVMRAAWWRTSSVSFSANTMRSSLRWSRSCAAATSSWRTSPAPGRPSWPRLSHGRSGVRSAASSSPQTFCPRT